jgi:hypothetical protein
MKIYGTPLPGTMDALIKDAIHRFGFAGKKDLLAYFRQRAGSSQPLFLDLLDKALPDWRSMTSAEDPDAYVMRNKLPYRAAKFVD